MESFLERILCEKHREVDWLKRNGPPAAMHAAGLPKRDFAGALSGQPGVSLIGEIKFSSPSAGAIRSGGNPVPIARDYAAAGAAALSVLTERRFFRGEPRFLAEIRAEVPLPILRKDFVIDPVQVAETAAYGADAILLIARILSEERMEELLGECASFGLTALVEVHSLEDAEKAVRCGAGVIAINNRDLETFEVDLKRTMEIRPLLPEECIVVSASGIEEAEEIRRLSGAGVDAVLVGTALMASGDLVGKARALVEAGRRRRTT